jgi:hypothetical protein
VQVNVAAVLLQADNAIEFLRGQQVAVFGVAQSTFRATKLPESLADHGCVSPSDQIFTWESALDSRKGAYGSEIAGDCWPRIGLTGARLLPNFHREGLTAIAP